MYILAVLYRLPDTAKLARLVSVLVVCRTLSTLTSPILNNTGKPGLCNYLHTKLCTFTCAHSMLTKLTPPEEDSQCLTTSFLPGVGVLSCLLISSDFGLLKGYCKQQTKKLAQIKRNMLYKMVCNY